MPVSLRKVAKAVITAADGSVPVCQPQKPSTGTTRYNRQFIEAAIAQTPNIGGASFQDVIGCMAGAGHAMFTGNNYNKA